MAAVLATLGAGAVPAWLSIPVTVLLALGVTQLLAVGMTSPLRQMTEAARRMAAGDYAVRVDTGSTDEVGELARAFNTMAADLATVDRQRRDLVASVSHELRTPLTALVAVLENLDDGVIAPDPQTVHVARAPGRAAQRPRRRPARPVPGRRRRGPARPRRPGARSAGRGGGGRGAVRPGASQRASSFDVRVEPPDLAAYADRARLHQLLANLLDNAARHSPAGGVVQVWAGVAGGMTRLEVADEGPGIAPEDRERVFERFGTLPDAPGGGTGLGLAIARWVTDLHGGRITVVDPVPGETGARFRVELPARPPPTEDAAPERDRCRRTQPHHLPAPAPSAAVPPLSPRTTRAPARSSTTPSAASGATATSAPLRWVLLACLAIGLFAGLDAAVRRPRAGRVRWCSSPPACWCWP